MYWISVRFYGMDDIPSIYLKSKKKCSNKTIICPNHESDYIHERVPSDRIPVLKKRCSSNHTVET